MSQPRIDPDGIVAWIAEQSDLDSSVIRTVLDLEFEFMVGVGIAYSMDGTPWRFRFHDPTDLAGEPRVVDTKRLAEDAERFTGIPFDRAHLVFEKELEYMTFRGLVR